MALMGKRTLRQLRTIPAYKEVMKNDWLYVAAEKITQM